MGCRAGDHHPQPHEPRRGSPLNIILFVYGTLKHGFDAHDRLCPDATDISYGATVCGDLYELPQGYPALVANENDVLARATTDPNHDALVQKDISEKIATLSRPRNIVYGQLIRLPDPQAVIPLDEYEGCFPGGDGLYDRVLIPASTPSITTAAWTYVVPDATGAHLPGGTWPQESDKS